MNEINKESNEVYHEANEINKESNEVYQETNEINKTVDPIIFRVAQKP